MLLSDHEKFNMIYDLLFVLINLDFLNYSQKWRKKAQNNNVGREQKKTGCKNSQIYNMNENKKKKNIFWENYDKLIFFWAFLQCSSKNISRLSIFKKITMEAGYNYIINVLIHCSKSLRRVNYRQTKKN